MLPKLLIKKRIYTEPYAQCQNCSYGESLPMRGGWLDGHKENGVIRYGHFKQLANGLVYHNCGDVWHLCKLIY